MIYLVQSGDIHRVVNADSPMAAAVLAVHHEAATLKDDEELRMGVIATIHLIPENLEPGQSIDLYEMDDHNRVIHTERLLQAAYPPHEGVNS